MQDWWWWCKEVWRTEPWLHPGPSCRGSACPHRGRNPIGNRRRRSTATSVSVCLAALRGRTRPRGGRDLQSTAWRTLHWSWLSTCLSTFWAKFSYLISQIGRTLSQQFFPHVAPFMSWCFTAGSCVRSEFPSLFCSWGLAVKQINLPGNHGRLFPANSLVDAVFLFVCLPVCVPEFPVNHWQWGNDILMGFTLSRDGAWLIWHQENEEENESVYLFVSWQWSLGKKGP